MSIELKNITKHFGNVHALEDVSITFGDNKIYGLLGNNGAGKTTMLNIITNKLFANHGQVLVDGESAVGNDRALGKMFMMSEQNLFPEEMKVKKAFAAAQIFYPDFDMDYALELAARFGLNIKKKITALSTGYGSIFRLILALSVNTPYLLLDEPVLGLDAQHRDMFYKLLLEKYAEKPCTIIISTHLIHEASSLIEHAVIVREGHVIKNSPVEQLLVGAFNVSGPAGAVDEYLKGRKVISESVIGGLKTACVEGSIDERPEGLEFGRVELQDYFINLMNMADKA